MTDKDGRVVLPVADFDNGPIHVHAGDYGSFVTAEEVRKGGSKGTGDWSVGRRPETPNVVFQLVPQRPSFAQLVFGWVR